MTEWDGDLERVLAFATEAHKDQTDKAGRPYIRHPIRVAEYCDDHHHKAIALLHDTVEDTDATLEQIAEAFGYRIAAGVDGITRRKRDGQDERHESYYARCWMNPDSRRVKMADALDNLDEDRLHYLDEETQARLRRKYHKAIRYMLKGPGSTV